MAHYESLDALLSAQLPAEEHTSQWMPIEQSRITDFADATDDHQWIHVDEARASSGPYGTTIAHGYLTLALLPALLEGNVEVAGAALRINYGLDHVRFLTPVPSGARVRAVSRVVETAPASQGARVTLEVRVEIEGAERPALVAHQLLIVVGDEQ
ncbi:hypothetical protein ASD65_02195 [Microbacterium sp. Root61]|uniref:MaoC family dehydratase n=1 Tax=Microbacterium sp. Root61 TaxID=1736570 RepID=UPI0006FE5483|nr:MaoC family dehydratase [Microbacterium sp. Root61]KRA23357.1 hypothetical protein ASD65_02195 [Microbacterium sp. Root61]